MNPVRYLSPLHRVIALLLVVLAPEVSVAGGPELELPGENGRPIYHFTALRDSLCSPAGALFSGGEYHLLYQTLPSGNWEMAVSRDLLDWERKPVSFPSPGGRSDSSRAILEGCLVADTVNLLGLQTGEHKTFLFYYTLADGTLRMAWSADRGATWQEYAGNPVIRGKEHEKPGCPQLFFHGESGQWVMLLFRIPEGDERKQGFSFYTSADLVHWKYQSHLAGFSDRPGLVQLRVNNRAEDTRWVLFEGGGGYVIGSFDGEEFKPGSHRLQSDHGVGFADPLTFGGQPATGERCLQIATLNQGNQAGKVFSGQYTFPCELSLKKLSAGLFLVRQPAREIESVTQKGERWGNKNLIPGINQNLIRSIRGESLRIRGRFNLKTCESFGFMLRAGKKNPGTELLYNVRKQTLSLLGQTFTLEPADQVISLDILVDRTSVEVFANDGQVVASFPLFSPEGDRSYLLFNTGGELMVEELSISEIAAPGTEKGKPGRTSR